ncbi:hypothetical protein H5410_055727 [Solanum commersonii]|uniref:Uncharacterized protein n=1 Tax=Solanum commersonii TaxID=4109 RepID=A0A9J5WIC7_SOLCO|nr:hypothetical protein H5410_055727 [Solanum commersonii]
MEGCMGDDEVREYGVCFLGCMKERTVACIFDQFVFHFVLQNAPSIFHIIIIPQQLLKIMLVTLMHFHPMQNLHDAKRWKEAWRMHS